MKKLCFLILSVLLLTGCNAEYNLVYENDVLNESFNASALKYELINGEAVSSLVDRYYTVPLLVNYKLQPGDMNIEECDFCEFYNKSVINNNGLYGININYTFKEKGDIVNSSLVYTMFKNIEVTDKFIKASEGKNIFLNYDLLDEIVVNFRTDKKVIDVNADEIKDDEYYWYINENNYENKTIKIEFDSSININEYNENVNSLIKYVFFGLGICLAFGIIFVIIKFSNSNKR